MLIIMTERLALTSDGNLESYSANSTINYIDFQKENESKDEFLKRVSACQRYSCYMCKDNDIYDLKQLLNKMIPEDIIKYAEKESNGESWIIAYGYNDKPYCNKGSWGKTEVYPFITSDGKSFIDMYITNYRDLTHINEDNFITPFNKNKDILELGNIDVFINNNFFALDKKKRLYKVNYPNVDDYKHVFIKHIPSYLDKQKQSNKRKNKNNKKNKPNE